MREKKIENVQKIKFDLEDMYVSRSGGGGRQ